MLPSAKWDTYHTHLKALGRRQAASQPHLALFLEELQLVDGSGQTLTYDGKEYFRLAFILRDEPAAAALVKSRLLQHPIVVLICQVFHGRGPVSREQLEDLLRHEELLNPTASAGERVSAGQLLSILNRFGVVRYSTKTGKFSVLERVKTNGDALPTRVFLPPDTPFSNVQRMRELLGQASGRTIWLDKHFDRKAFPLIADAIDGQLVPQFLIVSGPYNVDDTAKTEFRLLKKELALKGITLTWAVVPRDKLRDLHDRWLISASRAYNVPPVNSIYAAQAAEISESADSAQAEQFALAIAARGAEVD